jgi:hypothetical protein
MNPATRRKEYSTTKNTKFTKTNSGREAQVIE